jgi:hypothetical protein
MENLARRVSFVRLRDGPKRLVTRNPMKMPRPCARRRNFAKPHSVRQQLPKKELPFYTCGQTIYQSLGLLESVLLRRFSAAVSSSKKRREWPERGGRKKLASDPQSNSIFLFKRVAVPVPRGLPYMFYVVFQMGAPPPQRYYP